MTTGLFIRHRRFLAGAAFLTAVGLLIWLWPKAPSPFPMKLPTPNGYDDLVKAGNAMRPDTEDPSKVTTAELRALVPENEEALRLMQEGLSKECVVPVEPSVAFMEAHLQEQMLMKRLARLSTDRGRLSEVEMNYGQAALIHLDTIRLSHHSVRGGLIIDKLVGVAIETMGVQGLERIVERLTAAEARNILRAVEMIDSQSSPASEFIARDRAWARASLGMMIQVQEWLARRLIASSDQKFTSKVQTGENRRRQLILNLATHVHKLETGHPPKRPEDLVPSVLRALPKLDTNK